MDEIIHRERLNSKIKYWQDQTNITSSNASELLTLYKENSKYIESYLNKSDFFEFAEIVIICACICYDMNVAISMHTFLKDHFPESQRVSRLALLIYQSKGRLTETVEHYDKLIEQNPIDLISQKRQIAALIYLHKNEEQNSTLIELLTKYLEKYQSDHEAWLMLFNLYIRSDQEEEAKILGYAKYCLEELMLNMPDNRHLFCRYAEITAYQHNTHLARQYFIYSSYLCPKWIRPYFGLLSCSDRKRDKKQIKFAYEQIKDILDKSKTTFAQSCLKYIQCNFFIEKKD